MKAKKLFLILIIVLSITLFFGSVDLGGSVEFNLNYEFPEEEESSFYNNFNKADLYFKFFGDGLRGEFNLNKASDDKLWVSSSKFTFNLNHIDLTTYWNRKSVSTDDWLKIVNNEKVGAVNGVKVYSDLDKFGKLNFYAADRNGYLFNLLHYRFADLAGINSSVLYLKDYKDMSKRTYNELMGFDFDIGSFDAFKPYGEVVVSFQQDIYTASYDVSDNYLLFGGVRGKVGDFSYNFNTTYIADDFNKSYSPDSLAENIFLETAYKNVRLTNKLELEFGEENYIDRLRTNLYINNFELYVSPDFDGSFSDFNIDGSEMSVTYSHDLSIPFFTWYKVSLYKQGPEDDWKDIKHYKPFRVYLEGNYKALGFSGNMKYIFGNPVSDEFFQALGELYYIDISRNINQFSVMGKLQFIQGIVEKRFTAYAEVGYNLPNGNIKFYVGDGDFENTLQFKKQIGVTTTFYF
ncbi:hypothetical protein [Defluviitoga tunisiensis]|uniref:Uncharacterized protein n=1 Tax=Defluviitoga tunisiensis TaxID=1006576 RepID=A0A0C7NQN3_DEFTU|nr:hypothetical protein [Defluviitoga tunisiensis]CEP78177.1 hypothetical protein DTL3_0870 [Defluviitoga tunisiensis]